MTFEDLPYPLHGLALCGCLMGVQWLVAGRDGVAETGNYVGMWTGSVNAARNCPFCQGSGFDEDRLVGALLRILDRWIRIIERVPGGGGYRIRFNDGLHERIALGDSFALALLQVYEAVRVPDGEWRALGTNGQLEWLRRDPLTLYRLPPR